MDRKANRHTPWFLASLLVIGVQLLTLRIEPPILQDEVQILDYGRTVLEPETDWGMSWDVVRERSVLLPPYPAIALQELAYRVLAPSHAGPRILSLFAAVLAAGCALGWLLARGVPHTAAWLLALALLIDPIFSLTYRGGRVDAWALAACFAACWLLRAGQGGRSRSGPERRRLFLAGACAALAPFFWFTAVVLLPLILVELLERSRSGPAERTTVRTTISDATVNLLPFVLGGTLAVALVSPPIVSHADAYLSGFQSMMAIQQRAAVIQQPIPQVLGVHDPAVFLVAVMALIVRRDIGLLLALLLAAVMMHRTMVYAPRVMYLLPYLLAIIGGACQVLAGSPARRYMPALGRLLLALLLLWNAAVVLVYRPVTAWKQWPASAPEPVFEGLQQALGKGPHRVLMEEWHGYYAGRTAGWKMYRAGSPVSSDRYREFLQSMDFVVLRAQPHVGITERLAQELGFVLHTRLEFPRAAKKEFSFGLIRHSASAQGYPPLKIYRSPDADTLRL